MRKMMKKKAKGREKGFSLIEVLLAIVILGLVATPILQLFITSANISRNSKELLAATDVANITMEYVTGSAFDVSKTGVKAELMPDKDDPNKVATRIQGLSGSLCKTAEAPGAASIASHAQFESALKSASITATGTQAYYVDQSSYFGVAIFNVQHDNYKFDILMSFVPDKKDASDKFFIYDVTLDVYVMDEVTVTDGAGNETTEMRNFATKLVSMTGAIANE